MDLGNLPNGEAIPEIKEQKLWAVEGYPLFGYWDYTYTYNDANGDGVLAVDEVTISDEEEYLGSSIPTKDFSANTSVTLFNRVRISALMDYRGGHKLWNLTESFRCGFAICEGFNDPNAPLPEQARAIAAALASPSTDAGHIEDASFWKLREVGATLFIPEEWLGNIGADRASLTLTGRNLMTWSDYSGPDPEVNGTGQSNFFIRDFLTQPPVRTFVARINITF